MLKFDLIPFIWCKAFPPLDSRGHYKAGSEVGPQSSCSSCWPVFSDLCTIWNWQLITLRIYFMTIDVNGFVWWRVYIFMMTRWQSIRIDVLFKSKQIGQPPVAYLPLCIYHSFPWRPTKCELCSPVFHLDPIVCQAGPSYFPNKGSHGPHL